MVRAQQLPDLPAAPGAYILVITLGKPLRLSMPGMRGTVLEPGRYVYCGSARGPGGIRARVQRHLRRDKKLHWHIDHLTEAGEISQVHALPGADECVLLERILAIPGATTPAPGFGSTDCRRCPAHLAWLPAKIDVEYIARWVSETLERGEIC